MRNFGWVLIVLALGSLGLKAFGYDLLHARWADAAGETAGYALRGLAVGLGLAMILIDRVLPGRAAAGHLFRKR